MLAIYLTVAATMPCAVHADSSSSVLQMSVTVANSCNFSSPSYTLDLTGYDPVIDNVVSGVVRPSFTCSSDGTVKVATTTANAPQACVNTGEHAMLDDRGHALCYTLFTDAAHTAPLSAAPQQMTVAGNQPTVFPLFGSISQGQKSAFVGATYRDSITITITVDDAGS